MSPSAPPRGRRRSARPDRIRTLGRRGPPLLLVAGLASRARLWGELPRLLADRFTVLAPDNRGVGGSAQASAFTLEGAADDASP